MNPKLMGIKKGMTRLFDQNGNLVVCTVILAEPNVISQVKRKESDGYEAIQLSALKLNPAKAKKVSKPLQGHFAKAGVERRRHLMEARVEKTEQYAVGQEIDVTVFNDCLFVDVSAVSKGKGHQGVIKRHGFAGGPASHGSGFHRHGGSCGMRTSPGRCLPGQKKSGRMGADFVTMQNLEVVKIDKENNLIVVKGAVPGARGSLVCIAKANKMQTRKK
jgi:large subunit ribosomal protein L3